ncbi:MAG: CAP domain-containing protein [Actinomycetota bacterium]|nr:CAP domain-containing protein [Actinomycetota bacterium]
MLRTRGIRGTVIVVAVAFILLASQPLAFASGLSAQEQHLYQSLNAERTSRGLQALQFDFGLTAVARAHSQEMINLNYFAHNSPVTGSPAQRVLAAGIADWRVMGENLAGAPSVEIAHAALMNSPGHRANILRPEYNYVGIGIVAGGPYGYMMAQEFLFRPAAVVAVSAPSTVGGAVGEIYGRVISGATGRAITGTCVRVNNCIMPTNANGEFRFTLVHTGTYTVYYDAPGYVGQIQECITVNGGVTTCPTVIMSQAN